MDIIHIHMEKKSAAAVFYLKLSATGVNSTIIKASNIIKSKVNCNQNTFLRSVGIMSLVLTHKR